MKMQWQAVPGVQFGSPETTLAKLHSVTRFDRLGYIWRSKTALCTGLCDCSDNVDKRVWCCVDVYQAFEHADSLYLILCLIGSQCSCFSQCHMVEQSYTSDKSSYSCVEHLLRWVSWQFCQNRVTVVKSREHKCRNQLHSNLTTDIYIRVSLSQILLFTTDKYVCKSALKKRQQWI